MRHFKIWMFLLSLSCLLPKSGASAQLIPGQGSADWERGRREYTADVLRDYNATMSAWRAAWQRGDTAALADFYGTEAYFVSPEQQVVRGKQAIRHHLARGGRVVDLRTGLTDFVASERLAYAAGPFWYQRETNGDLSTISGTYVVVLVREPGRWRIRSQVFTVDQPAASSQDAP